MVTTATNTRAKRPTHSVTSTRIVLRVEYDGTCYHGFQLQTELPTIQEEIEKGLRKLTGECIRVLAASRTDTGVHARGQVVSFKTSSSLHTRTFISGLNYHLPTDIAIKAAYRLDDSFDVRRNATSREYRYHILNSPTRSPLADGYSYQVGGKLNIKAMNIAGQKLIGKHDFASFATCINDNQLKKTVRNIYRVSTRIAGELAIFEMEANSFLPHQVRNTIGTLIRVGLEKMSLDEFCSIIEAHKPGLAGPTAPAKGLYLTRVNYAHTFAEGCHD